jgi:hypothetical protein
MLLIVKCLDKGLQFLYYQVFPCILQSLNGIVDHHLPANHINKQQTVQEMIIAWLIWHCIIPLSVSVLLHFLYARKGLIVCKCIWKSLGDIEPQILNYMHRPIWWKHYVVMSVKGYKFKVSSISFADALVTDVDCS